ncbi:MAG: transcriptional regulator MntR [Halobacteriota archaeon]|nr:transcriptional regulator MntR [Halobacteriota archaeon]
MISKTVEEYMEVIYELIKEKGYARTVDISSRLDVQPPSVTEMIQKLDENGFLVYEKYRGLKLTQKGEDLAKSVCQRHETLAAFLKIIGVDEKIAEEDACKIEHSINTITMNRLTKFVEFVQNAPHDPEWLEHFEFYVRTGKRIRCCDKD